MSITPWDGRWNKYELNIPDHRSGPDVLWFEIPCSLYLSSATDAIVYVHRVTSCETARYVFRSVIAFWSEGSVNNPYQNDE